MKRMDAAVLGATGMIGQRFVQLLEDHPYFDISSLNASERSEGKTIKEVLKVKDHDFKEETLEGVIQQIDVDRIARECRIAFSGLPSDIARGVETELAERGVAVFSNASSHRMREDVPLLIPEVNPDHLDMIETQETWEGGGFIVTNANCSTTGIALPLAALHRAFGLGMVSVSTYQAVSGAGYPGVSSLDILGNILPHIRGEEEKMEEEILKMLGTLEDGRVRPAGFDFLANCARVPVHDGHLESMTLTLEGGPDLEDIRSALSGFRADPQELELPTAPREPIMVMDEEDRPQPLLDSYAGEPARAKGMAVCVGRLRKKDTYYKLFALSHNTLRGGAGGSVLNAELAVSKGHLR
ncbi:MAG: aspartate-semialdehyde dehydrogenase [Thermoplasmatota archaeon]